MSLPCVHAEANRPTTRRRAVWNPRRLLRPLADLATQGLTPARLAATAATGTTCSLFPFLGTTSLLNLAAGLAFRMNHAALQALNQLLGPLQLALIPVFIRIGERLWNAPPQPFSIAAVTEAFSASTLGEFIGRFGELGVHAFTGWLATAPLLFALVWLPAHVIARGLQRRRGGVS